ncbi:hypothetical protein R3P38DRAFT_3339049 [Favolaschia claudopus]|uniref:Uncharacterized protein n=1 Tax=Favolaschia claudopus TaxID=2862362 RepID=A0AAW0ECV4_9AGAR
MWTPQADLADTMVSWTSGSSSAFVTAFKKRFVLVPRCLAMKAKADSRVSARAPPEGASRYMCSTRMRKPRRAEGSVDLEALALSAGDDEAEGAGDMTESWEPEGMENLEFGTGVKARAPQSSSRPKSTIWISSHWDNTWSSGLQGKRSTANLPMRLRPPRIRIRLLSSRSSSSGIRRRLPQNDNPAFMNRYRQSAFSLPQTAYIICSPYTSTAGSVAALAYAERSVDAGLVITYDASNLATGINVAAGGEIHAGRMVKAVEGLIGCCTRWVGEKQVDCDEEGGYIDSLLGFHRRHSDCVIDDTLCSKLLNTQYAPTGEDAAADPSLGRHAEGRRAAARSMHNLYGCTALLWDSVHNDICVVVCFGILFSLSGTAPHVDRVVKRSLHASLSVRPSGLTTLPPIAPTAALVVDAEGEVVLEFGLRHRRDGVESKLYALSGAQSFSRHGILIAIAALAVINDGQRRRWTNTLQKGLQTELQRHCGTSSSRGHAVATVGPPRARASVCRVPHRHRQLIDLLPLLRAFMLSPPHPNLPSTIYGSSDPALSPFLCLIVVLVTQTHPFIIDNGHSVNERDAPIREMLICAIGGVRWFSVFVGVARYGSGPGGPRRGVRRRERRETLAIYIQGHEGLVCVSAASGLSLILLDRRLPVDVEKLDKVEDGDHLEDVEGGQDLEVIKTSSTPGTASRVTLLWLNGGALNDAWTWPLRVLDPRGGRCGGGCSSALVAGGGNYKSFTLRSSSSSTRHVKLLRTTALSSDTVLPTLTIVLVPMPALVDLPPSPRYTPPPTTNE